MASLKDVDMTEIDYINAKSDYKSDLTIMWSLIINAILLLVAVCYHAVRGEIVTAVSVCWIPFWIMWHIPRYVKSINKNKQRIVLWEVHNA